MSQHEIRNAAENLLRSNNDCQINSNIQQSTDISQSHSINTIPSIRQEYVISGDLFQGRRPNGRMSNIRRFFCLFVTFDFLFTTLMWLICIMLDGDNIMDALKKQIYHYNIHTSLFDVVGVALCRFIFLLLFYALLYINHWIIIALSTATTSMFVASKVFCYEWQSSSQPVFQVLLVLISFVLAWGEAWFLDYRVIPQEFNASQYLIASPDNERTPLIRSYVQGLPSMYTESVGNFYSPLGSLQGSVHGFETVHAPPPMRLSKELEDKYDMSAKKALAESILLLQNTDWKKSKESTSGDAVFHLMYSKNKKIFKLSASLNIPARFLLEELYYNVEKIPEWNPTVLISRRVHVINESTDIAYQVAADGAMGAISSRDFVNLRHWELVEERYLIVCTAVEFPTLPKNEKYIRGENILACWEITPQSNGCKFQWILNTDLKGWFPQYIIDKAFVDILFDYAKNLRKYLTELKQSGIIM